MERPLIGLNTDVVEDGKGIAFFHRSRYALAVWNAGGRPILVPPLPDADPEELLQGLDGLVMVGGDDLSPALYGGSARHPEEVPLHPSRERFDMALVKTAVRIELPTLAVCLGLQELCVAFGGRLHPFLADDVPGAMDHRTAQGGMVFHPLKIASRSRLSRILENGIQVNSAHRQAVSEPGHGLVVAATAPDGVIEAVEGAGDAFLIGVQWHPELMEEAPALFRALVNPIAQR